MGARFSYSRWDGTQVGFELDADSVLSEMTDDLRTFATAENAALEAGDLDAAVEANLVTWVDGPGQPVDRVDPGVRARVGEMQRRAFELTAVLLDIGAADAARLDA